MRKQEKMDLRSNTRTVFRQTLEDVIPNFENDLSSIADKDGVEYTKKENKVIFDITIEGSSIDEAIARDVFEGLMTYLHAQRGVYVYQGLHPVNGEGRIEVKQFNYETS